MHNGVVPEVNETVPVSPLESPTTARVAVAPGEIVADDAEPFTVMENDAAESATSFATANPAFVIAVVTGAAPSDDTSAWPFELSTNRMKEANAAALDPGSPDVGTTK